MGGRANCPRIASVGSWTRPATGPDARAIRFGQLKRRKNPMSDLRQARSETEGRSRPGGRWPRPRRWRGRTGTRRAWPSVASRSSGGERIPRALVALGVFVPTALGCGGGFPGYRGGAPADGGVRRAAGLAKAFVRVYLGRDVDRPRIRKRARGLCAGPLSVGAGFEPPPEGRRRGCATNSRGAELRPVSPPRRKRPGWSRRSGREAGAVL